MLRPLSTAALVLTLLAGYALASAAQDAPTRFRDQVTVNEVLLDVLVTDSHGDVIIGLTPDDFVVEENGERIPVESLTFYSNRALLSAAAPSSVDIDRVPQDRLFILFFDDQRTKAGEAPRIFSQQMNAAQESKRWVRQELLPGDWVAVLSYGFKLKLHQDFTQDKDALAAAIDRAVRNADEPEWPSRAVKEDTSPFSLRRGLPTGNDLRDQTTTIYDALQVMSRAAGQIQGRKNLLLFTLGFGQVTSFGLYRPDSRYYPPTMQTLNDNNVAVYAIDLAPPGVDHTMQDALNQLALETGGEYLFNFTNFIKPLRRVSESNNGYYLLGYRSHHSSGESGYQKVKVSTTNPEFRVKARAGYLYGE